MRRREVDAQDHREATQRSIDDVKAKLQVQFNAMMEKSEQRSAKVEIDFESSQEQLRKVALAKNDINVMLLA